MQRISLFRNLSLPFLLFTLFLLSGPGLAQKRPTYWGSFVGGNGNESCKDVTLAANGDILVVGSTQSSDLKTGPNAFQPKRGGRTDAFVARLSGDGKQLLAITYLGGIKDDDATFVHEAKDGSIWVGGTTNSLGFPTTADAFAKVTGSSVAFLVLFDAKLTSLLYGTTYRSGTTTEQVRFCIDEKNSLLYMAGYLSKYAAGAIAASSNALRTKQANDDCYLAILDRSVPNKTTLKYGTYIGGVSDEESLDGMTVDAQGIVTLSGTTKSTDFPTTSTAFLSKRVGTQCGFVIRVDPNQAGSKGLVYGSYIGGSGIEYHLRHTADAQGLLHLALVSTSSDLPTTSQAVLTKYGGSTDVFYARLDPTKSGSSAVTYGSWIVNGNKGDGSTGRGRSTIALHPRGIVFYTPIRSSWWTLPTMSEPFQRGLRDTDRGYVVLLDTTTKSQPFLAYASEYGGIGWSGSTRPWSMVVHPSGDLILAGLTTKDLPRYSTAAQSQFGGASYDGFVSRLALAPWGSRFTSLGKACMGTAGLPNLKGLTAGIGVRDGKLGSLGVEASGMAKNRIAALLMGSDKTWLSIPLPLSIGTTGCTLQASPILVFAFATGTTGKWSLTLPAPLDANLVGSTLALQTLILDPKANAAGLVLSNGLLAEIGW